MIFYLFEASEKKMIWPSVSGNPSGKSNTLPRSTVSRSHSTISPAPAKTSYTPPAIKRQFSVIISNLILFTLLIY